MQCEYEITADEFASAQTLYHNLRNGRRRVRNAILWILAGLFLIVVAWNEKAITWTPLVLLLLGMWWVYAGLTHLFPTRHFRRRYGGSGLAGKRYKVDASEDGFEVTAELCSWKVQWPGVKFKGEDARVFMLYSEGTIFIFGKQYLNDDHQREFRRLSGFGNADS